MTTESVVDIALFPVKIVAWLLSLPIRLLDLLVKKLRKPYDPERVTCPGCGFSSRRGSQTCRISIAITIGPEKAMIEHDCLRCSAVFYTKTYKKVDEWMSPNVAQDTVAKVKEAQARQVL